MLSPLHFVYVSLVFVCQYQWYLFKKKLSTLYADIHMYICRLYVYFTSVLMCYQIAAIGVNNCIGGFDVFFKIQKHMRDKYQLVSQIRVWKTHKSHEQEHIQKYKSIWEMIENEKIEKWRSCWWELEACRRELGESTATVTGVERWPWVCCCSWVRKTEKRGWGKSQRVKRGKIL